MGLGKKFTICSLCLLGLLAKEFPLESRSVFEVEQGILSSDAREPSGKLA